MKKIKILGFISMFVIIFVYLISTNSYANTPQYLENINVNELCGKEFYIRNLLTGYYLDVSGGIAGDRTNVQQYEFNGTDSQKWFLRNNNDGTYTFFTRVGADTHYRYALDIADASNENCANVQIYTINATNA